MPDEFANNAVGIDGPAVEGHAVTPSDTVDLVTPIRALTIGGDGGTVSFIATRSGKGCTTAFLPPGTYPVLAKRIRASGTTATELTGWS